MVFKRCVLIKVYNTKVKYTYNDKVMYDKKDEFIDNMPDTDFCIETENRTQMVSLRHISISCGKHNHNNIHLHHGVQTQLRGLGENQSLWRGIC